MNKQTLNEWNAEVYHAVSQPQVSWGERVLSRLALDGHETVIDAGCGTGRLTEKLLERLPHGKVIAVDLSENMIETAHEYLRPFKDRVTFLNRDLAELELEDAADVILSTATLHWVEDHPRLFANFYRALHPGGRLLAQCGGAGNLQKLLTRSHWLMASREFAAFFRDWKTPWEFADPPTTEARLQAAGFVDINTGLEPAPTFFENAAAYRTFLGDVIFRLHLAAIPDETLRAAFLDQLTEQAAADKPPFGVDYWRLNISARKPDAVSPHTGADSG